MFKFRTRRGNIDRKDFSRAVVTDTAPTDTPIIFSNDGFHANLKRQASEPLNQIINALIRENKKRYTIPYRFRIRHGEVGSRLLSLSHPAAQMRACNFYREYGHLIPYFCRHAEVSLRRPAKVGGTRFFLTKRSNKNAYKTSAIDTLADDRTARNPASYFAYAKYRRFHEFFSSGDYVNLEKRFSIMRTLDISKCFPSIYSHTMAWAVKDVEHGKENVAAQSFANAFDRLMQFSNYNETNGIPVGAELSRIFAEIILQAVDVDAGTRLEKQGFRLKDDFEIRRYVDDYILFTRDVATADVVEKCLASALSEYNLHLNEGKSETLKRPFSTPKSQIISRLSIALNEFRAKITTELNGGFAPKAVRKPNVLVASFIRQMKLCCHGVENGYQPVSSYVIGSFAVTIESLIESFFTVKKIKDFDKEAYVSVFETLLSALFFFFAVNVTVTTSYQVAKSAILTVRFFRKELPQYAEKIHELIGGLISDLLSNPELKGLHPDECIPLEVLNVILAMGELPDVHHASLLSFEKKIRKKDLDYFGIVSLLFFFQDRNKGFLHSIEKAIDGWMTKADPLRKSHDAHLMLDLVACPYLSAKLRETILTTLQTELQLRKSTGRELSNLREEIEKNPWFVRWEHLNLLNHLRKKELSPVY